MVRRHNSTGECIADGGVFSDDVEQELFFITHRLIMTTNKTRIDQPVARI